MPKIYHPQIYLYNYQLSREIKNDDSSIWVWAKKLWQHFSTDPTPAFPPNDLNYPLSKAYKFSHSNRIDGSLRFCRLDDSEGILARVGSSITDGSLGLTSLKEFNPDNLLVPPKNNVDWLGQTIFITYKLRSPMVPLPEQLRGIADEYVKDLLPEFPPFYRATQLLDTDIFEYSSLQSQLQIFVYQIDDQIEKRLGGIIQPLFELFYYRHKITKTFIESRMNYDLAHKLSMGIETIIERLESTLGIKSNQYSQDLKKNIKQLMQDSLHYQRTLQTLENLDNTISIHLYNYQQKLMEISDRIQLPPEELTTFNLFIQKTAPYFQRQIQGDLGYFKHGTDLINTAITSIRGIVEIEQAESDRQRQAYEKNRDRKLQTLVAVVGVGIGTSGVAATASPYIFATKPDQEFTLIPLRFQPNLALNPPHNLTLSLLFSLSAGLVGVAIASRAIRRIQKHKNGTIARAFNCLLDRSKNKKNPKPTQNKGAIKPKHNP